MFFWFYFSNFKLEEKFTQGDRTIECVNGSVMYIDSIAPDLAMTDLSNLKIKSSQIQKSKKIGEGAYGIVYKGLSVWFILI